MFEQVIEFLNSTGNVGVYVDMATGAWTGGPAAGYEWKTAEELASAKDPAPDAEPAKRGRKANS